MTDFQGEYASASLDFDRVGRGAKEVQGGYRVGGGGATASAGGGYGGRGGKGEAWGRGGGG